MEPLWVQFSALLPVHVDTHPLGCHRPRISDRVVFDKLIQVLVLGAAYEKVADSTCSAATIGRRRDEWISADMFTALEQATLECLGRFGFGLLERITVHLDAGYDSRRTRELLEVLGCDARISPRGTPLQAGRRWAIERTNSWHTRGLRRLQICTEVRTRVIEAFTARPAPSSPSGTSSTAPGPPAAETSIPPASPNPMTRSLRLRPWFA